MTADVHELAALAAALGVAGAVIGGRAEVALAKTAFDIEGDAKVFVPVRTGNLRNSIGSDVEGLSADIGPTADYGGYVEFGTSKMAPQPYLMPATDRNLDGLMEALGQIGGDW